MALPKPPAKELAAIRARAIAAGHKPSAAAVLATYNRNQARAAALPKPPGRSAGGTFSTDNRKAPTAKRKAPRQSAVDQLLSFVGPTVDAHAEIAKKVADVGRYALPGSERQFLGALGRAFAGAIPGRIQAPRNDTWQALQEQQAFRRRFEQTGSTRPPRRLPPILPR